MSKQKHGTWTLETITPAMATQYLSRMLSNRSLKKGRVKLYAEQMASGRFAVTHQGIAFDNDGMLCDGQHRLNALLQSGVSGFETWVYRAHEIDVKKIDGHCPRSIADQITMSGIEMGRWEQSVLARMLLGVKHDTTTAKDVDMFSSQFELHRDAIAFAKQYLYGKKGRCSSSIVAAVVAALKRVCERSWSIAVWRKYTTAATNCFRCRVRQLRAQHEFLHQKSSAGSVLRLLQRGP
jgi:hypothetical protein